MLKQNLKLYAEIFLTFLKISTFTIGGGYAAIPLLKLEIVRRKNWISAEELTDVITISQVVPGLVYVSSSSFIGYRVAGVIGAALASIAVVIPSAIAIMLLAFLLEGYFQKEIVQNVLTGVIAGVTAMTIVVAVRLFKKSVTDVLTVFVFVFSFILLELYQIQTFILVMMGLILGLLYSYIKHKRNESKC